MTSSFDMCTAKTKYRPSVTTTFISSYCLLLVASFVKSNHPTIQSTLFCFWRDSPQWARASSVTRFLDHIRLTTVAQDSSGRMISSSKRPLPDNTQHSQQTDIHAPGGFRTHNLSRRAAVGLRLRTRSHWDNSKHIKKYNLSTVILNNFLQLNILIFKLNFCIVSAYTTPTFVKLTYHLSEKSTLLMGCI